MTRVNKTGRLWKLPSMMGVSAQCLDAQHSPFQMFESFRQGQPQQGREEKITGTLSKKGVWKGGLVSVPGL